MKTTRSEKVYQNFCTAVVLIFALVCLYPLLYTIFISLTPASEYDQRFDQGGGIMLLPPFNPTLAAYGKVLGAADLFLRAMGISIGRAALGTVTGIVFAAIVAFALSRPNLPGKKAYLYLILFTILFSSGLIPGYLVVQDLGLKNTFWSMVIPGLFSTWNVLVFKQFFEGIPKELEEAAEVDGVNDMQLFLHIIIPMSKPVLAAIGLFTMVGHWNNWFDASIYIESAYNYLWPLQLLARKSFLSGAQMANGGLEQLMNMGGGRVNETAMKMAITVITVFPILCVYPFFQKYFTKGIYMGAVKG